MGLSLDSFHVLVPMSYTDANTEQAATDILTQDSGNLVPKANFDALKIIALEGWRPEEIEFDKTGKAFEAFFKNEDAQVAKQNENKPPSVDKVKFSNTRPAPGTNCIHQRLRS